MILLKAKPLLISRCLNAIPISWDQPVLSYSYVSSLSYICYLLDATDIDHNLLHSFSSSTKIASLSDSDVKNVVTELCNSLLPTGTGVISSLLTRPGLTKKDLSRLLQHSSPLLRRMGFILYLRLLQRIKRSLAMLESSTHLFTTVQGHLTSLLTNIFPDIQLLLSARAR